MKWSVISDFTMKLNKILIIPFLALTSVASAQVYSYGLNSSSNGWVDDSGYGDTSNPNYIAGKYSSTEYRNYFNFDFSGVIGSITDATITIDTPSGSFNSVDSNEVFALSLVDTTIDFDAPSISSLDFFNDLGDGSFIGSTIMSNSTGGSISIQLSQAFIDRANQNGFVTIGGANISIGSDPGTGTDSEYMFGSSGLTSNPVTLNITVDPDGDAVPEPSSALFLSFASISLIIRRKR